MSNMFEGYKGTTLDLSTFDTSQATDIGNMFYNCENLTTLDLSSFDTSSVTDMSSMFFNCTNLKELPFKDWPSFVTSSVTDMSSMFRNYKGTTLDLNTFDTSNVTKMNQMFYSCTNLRNLPFQDWPSFVASSVTDMSSMFGNCRNLTTLDLSTFDTLQVTNMRSMFYSTSANITFPEGFGSAATDMSSMFREYQGTTLDLSSFDTSSVTNMSSMFSSLSSKTSITFPQGFGSAATDMSNMFEYYKGTTLDLSTFDTSSVTNMNNMFSTCTKLTELKMNIATFDGVKTSGKYTKMFGYSESSSRDFRVPSNIQITVKKGQEEFIKDRLTEIYPDYDYTNNITIVD